MDHYSYTNFRLDIEQHIRQHLQEKGQNGEVSFFSDGYAPENQEAERFILETNEKYGHSDAKTLVGDFILISFADSKEGGHVCRFEVKYLFDEFVQNGWDRVDLIVDENIRHAAKADTSVLSALNDYSKVKDKLILCLRNAAMGKIRFRDSVFQKYEDMAMVLYVILSDDGKGNRLITPVPRFRADSWGMEDDDILAAALLNTAKLSPPRMYRTFEDTIANDPNRGDFMDPLSTINSIPTTVMGAVITAIPNTDGAVAMFYPGVMERLSDMAHGDYYVVFTAKDEAHIHIPGTVSVKFMRDALRDTNKQFPADMLTINVFYYDSKRKKLKKVR